MALTVGTNSFISVADADIYFSNRLDSTKWDDADTATKEQALIQATTILNPNNWIGYVEDTTQELAFPRIGEYYEPVYGQYIPMIDIPKRVRNATCENALHQITHEGVLNSGSGSELDKIVVGSITLEGKLGGSTGDVSDTPEYADDLILPLIDNSSNPQASNIWWRAN